IHRAIRPDHDSERAVDSCPIGRVAVRNQPGNAGSNHGHYTPGTQQLRMGERGDSHRHRAELQELPTANPSLPTKISHSCHRKLPCYDREPARPPLAWLEPKVESKKVATPKGIEEHVCRLCPSKKARIGY